MSDGRCPVCDTAWTETRSIMTNEVWYDCPKCKKTREQIEKELQEKKAPEKTKQSSYSGFDPDATDVPDWGDYDWTDKLNFTHTVPLDYTGGEIVIDPVSGKAFKLDEDLYVELDENSIPKDLLTNKTNHLRGLSKTEISATFSAARYIDFGGRS